MSGCGELKENLRASRRPEIECHALLVSGFAQPNVRIPNLRGRAESAEGITLPGLLDLDDLSSEVREDRSTERGGYEGRNLKDAYASEWA